MNKATDEENQALKKKGPTGIDINKVKETWLKQYREDLKENSYWLSKLLQIVENPSAMSTMLKGEQRINAITAKEIQEAANRYFDQNNFLQVVLNPEK